MAVKPIKVSQLNNYIKRILQTDPILGNISVTGEISNFRKPGRNAHAYFSLKDQTSSIRCFLSGDKYACLDFELEEGMEVIVHGFIYLHIPNGQYSINISVIEAAGQGDLAAAFAQLKAKLTAEGLFDQKYKKAIPGFPHKVAVVTSASGAAVRDIQKIIRQKNDYVDILIYPVLVQGVNAAGEISAAIDDLNENHKDVDVMIVGRGGGSAEDLWAFNEEIVARSIFRSQIPVISAVGHETDFTIADFVADLRAETPTAAADKAVPDTFLMREYLAELQIEMKRNLRMVMEDRRKALALCDPHSFGRDIQSRIAMEQMRTETLRAEMEKQVAGKVSECRHRLALLKETLDGADPKRILQKGYSVVTDETGHIVKDASLLKRDQMIKIEAAAGFAEARVTKAGKER